MPEVGLGIGRYRGIFAGIQQELLCWYDEQGNRYLTADENAFYQQQRAEQERQRAEKLAQYLRSIGVDPDNLPSN